MEGLVLENLREDYRLGALDEAHCDPDPLRQFELWMQQARESRLREPNAMTLATASADGRPSARIVLLKEITSEGLVFYSNYTSRKGRELDANPNAALTFYWAELERQVRVEGHIARLDRPKSQAYFQSRPRTSRLGALVSHQSEPIPSRQVLDQRLEQLSAEYADTDNIPMPEWWGGYLVTPRSIEFWQGRTSRLHDRILYSRSAADLWQITRLSP